jgi:hypothetical protein
MNCRHVLVLALTIALSGAVHAGAFYKGVCYDNAALATDAIYSDVLPTFIPGATEYMQTFYKLPSGAWQSLSFSKAPTATSWTFQSQAALPVHSFATCNNPQFLTPSDVVTLSWLVVGCLAVGFSVRQIRSAI